MNFTKKNRIWNGFQYRINVAYHIVWQWQFIPKLKVRNINFFTKPHQIFSVLTKSASESNFSRLIKQRPDYGEEIWKRSFIATRSGLPSTLIPHENLKTLASFRFHVEEKHFQ